MHQSGVTTALDMGTGVFGNPLQEIEGIRAVAEAYPVPSRIILTPIILDFMARQVPPEAALAEVKAWQLNNSERVKIGNHFKLMLDGAIFSGLSQFGPPGYLDGHEGVWMAPREATYDYAKTFSGSGCHLHAHANDDAPRALLLDLLANVLTESP